MPGTPDISALLERSFNVDVLILHEDELGERFFRLSEGLLGELFQKIVNYRRKLAVIVSDEDAYGERVRQLIYEHRSHTTIRFFRSDAAAQAWAAEIVE